jgi:hypothetical protein
MIFNINVDILSATPFFNLQTCTAEEEIMFILTANMTWNSFLSVTGESAPLPTWLQYPDTPIEKIVKNQGPIDTLNNLVDIIRENIGQSTTTQFDGLVQIEVTNVDVSEAVAASVDVKYIEPAVITGP